MRMLLPPKAAAFIHIQKADCDFILPLLPGVIALFCRQYDIIKDNEPNNNKDKAKNSSECSTPEHPTGGLLRSKV